MPTQEMEELKVIFSRNLRKYLELNDKNQVDLQKRLNVSSSTASYWTNGIKMPRMDKLQYICDWLGIEKSDLLEEKDEAQISKETIEKFSPLLAQLSKTELDTIYNIASSMLMADKYKEGVNGQNNMPAADDRSAR